MRASLQSFITREKDRRDRINYIWRPLKGKCGILADYVNATDSINMIADPDMILTGLNATSATSAVAVESGGNFYAVVASTVNGATQGVATLANSSPINATTFGTDQETEAEFLFQIDAVVTDRWGVVGMRLTNGISDTDSAQTADNDQVYVAMNDSASFDLGISINGTDTLMSDIHLSAVSDYVHVKFAFDASGFVKVYINGQEYNLSLNHFGGSVGAGNIVDLLPFCGVLEASSGGADPKVNLVALSLSRALGA